MDEPFTLTIVAHVHRVHALWYVLEKRPGKPKRLVARGSLPLDHPSCPQTDAQIMMEVAYDAYRVIET